MVVELAWLSRLLHELSVEDITPVPLKCDNQAAIYIAKNPIFHERTNTLSWMVILSDKSSWKDWSLLAMLVPSIN